MTSLGNQLRGMIPVVPQMHRQLAPATITFQAAKPTFTSMRESIAAPPAYLTTNSDRDRESDTDDNFNEGQALNKALAPYVMEQEALRDIMRPANERERELMTFMTEGEDDAHISVDDMLDLHDDMVGLDDEIEV